MIKKKVLASVLCLSLAAASLAGCGSSPDSGSSSQASAPAASSAPSQESSTAENSGGETDKAPVELTIWVTSRNTDDWSASMENQFLEEHPWITLNKVVKEGDPGNEFYQAVAAGTAPDLVRCSFTVMNSYMAAGILEPLNRYTDSWDEWGSFTKEYVDMFTRDGSVAFPLP